MMATDTEFNSCEIDLPEQIIPQSMNVYNCPETSPQSFSQIIFILGHLLILLHRISVAYYDEP